MKKLSGIKNYLSLFLKLFVRERDVRSLCHFGGRNKHFLSSSKMGNAHFFGTTVLMCCLTLLTFTDTHAQITPDANGIVYVRPTATGIGNGSSWANATNNLQQAINAAGADSVLVAVGNYDVPSPNSFIMKNGVKIYGGFNPVSNTTDWNTRTLPNKGIDSGSVLNGKNERSVIYNDNNVLDTSALLDGFTLMNGEGNNGGAIYNNNVAPVFNNLVIRNNEATTSGGAMYNLYSPIILSNSIIKDNTAAYGGGIRNNNSAAKLTNVSITGNSATQNTGGAGGGGIFNELSDLVLANVLIAGNSTERWGGGFRNLSGNPVFTNVTIANNTAPLQLATTAMEIAGGTPQINTSVIYGTITGTYTPQYSLIQGNTNFTNGNIDALPYALADIFTNPSAGNYTLKNLSPAVNAGNNTLFPNLSANSKDLSGNARVHNYANSGKIDMGACESTYTPIVPTSGIVYVKDTATGKEDGSTWADATSDLHNAIHTNGVQQVYVAVGNYPVGDHSFVMKNGVAIYGGFDPDNGISTLAHNRILANLSTSEGSVLDGENTRNAIWNVFTSSTALGNTAVLDGFTIKNGYNNGGSGGGIHNVFASPTLSNLVIKDNYAVHGGGMNNTASSPVVNYVKFKNNTAIDGAAIWNTAISSPTFTNVEITGNTTTVSNNTEAVVNSSNSSGTLTFKNVTIAGNNTPGALFHGGGNLTIDNSIIYGGRTGSGTYAAQHSLIQGNDDFTNGNINTITVPLNKLFTDPANGDYTLRPGSPAINAGSNALFPGLNGSTKDLADNARVFDYNNGGTIDMGVYESSHPGLTLGANGIIYVKETYSGNGSGSDWANATDNLHHSIHKAGVQQVFVAVGNYPVGAHSFIMKNGVEIFGGFDPLNGVSDLTHKRILPNHGVAEGSVLDGQNVRPVIWNDNNSLINSAILDGFTVKNGYSDYGGGIHNVYASPLLRNLLVKTNRALWGGGISAQSSSSPTITDVLIYDNLSYGAGGGGGGAMYSDDGAPVLTNVAIIGNRANLDVGGYYCRGGMPVFNNVTIAGNQQEGFLAISGGNIALNNSIVYNNGFINHGTYTAQHSLIQGSSSTANGNIDATGFTAADIFTSPGTGNYTLTTGSPAIDMGSNALFSGLNAATKDLRGKPRVFDFNSSGIIDIGAYEFEVLSDKDTFVTIWTAGPGETLNIHFPGLGSNYHIAYKHSSAMTYTVVTGNGVTELPNTTAAGTYEVRVSPGGGTFYGVNNSGDYLPPWGTQPNRMKLTEVKQWGNIEWTSLANAFIYCSYIDVTATDTPNLSGVTNLSRMFFECATLENTNGSIATWDVSNITNMNRMFARTPFNQPIGDWNTSNVEDMAFMFYRTTAFDQPLNSWNVGKVEDMEAMFAAAEAFDQPLNNWDVSKVENMAYMFSGDEGTVVFNQPIGSWNTGNVRDMSYMFSSAEYFDQALNNWDVSKVENMERMFAFAESFNRPLGSWDVSKVEYMNRMFQSAYDFNQDLGTWNLSSVIDMEGMLNSSGLDCQNYSGTLIGWAVNVATPDNITFGAGYLEYGPDANVARNKLININNWDISNEDEYDPACIFVPLPIELLSFTARKEGSTVLLQWVTVTERNNKGFEIEHSADGSNWNNIGFASSKAKNGSSSYRLDYGFRHHTPVGGENLYRLKQLDFDGKFGYSPVRMVSFEAGNKQISIYPNPASDNVNITGLKGGERIMVYDVSGRLVMEQDCKNVSESVLLSRLHEGVYQIRIVSKEDIAISIHKLVKVN